MTERNWQNFFRPEDFSYDVQYVVQLPPMESYLLDKICNKANAILREEIAKAPVVSQLRMNDAEGNYE